MIVPSGVCLPIEDTGVVPAQADEAGTRGHQHATVAELLVAIHQVLEKVIKLRSNLYSIRVLTYYVDGQLSSIKQITQATGDLQAI